MSVKSGAGAAISLKCGENVLLAIFADIHANRQAFGACLDVARARGAERMIFLGDYVGYGADPEWTVEVVMGMVDRGAMAVLGNHDQAVGIPTITFNAEAQAAIEWTRGRLGMEQRRFLAQLPLALQEEDRLYVHSEASRPANWHYVQSTWDAARSIMATSLPVTLCGHIHSPALYSMSAAATVTGLVPASGVAVQLHPGRRWLAVLGSVGSPATATPRPRLRCSIPGAGKSPIAAFPTISRRQPPGFAKMACRSGWPTVC
jgi:predicted phosphodiesterase